MISAMFKDKQLENKIFYLLIAIATIAVINTGLSVHYHVKNFFLSPIEGLSEEASKRDFCGMAMNQMIQKKLSKLLIEDSLYSQVVENNYKAMFFEDEDKVTSVYSGENLCKVLVHTKEGQRSFDLALLAEADFPYFYKISKIHENDLYAKEDN
jgi:hypothetical protein